MKKLSLKLISLVLALQLVAFSPASIVWAQDATETTQTAENTNTGSTSDNTSSNTTTNTETATNTNDATNTNNTTNTTDSGTNDASSNTGTGTVATSDSTNSTTTTTQVNQTSYEPMPWTTWTGSGDWTTRSTNTSTGSNSTNTATNTNNTTQNLTNTNNATLDNNTTSSATTGSNTASNNTGDGSINTGNASTSTNTQNIANTNLVKWTGEGDWTNLWQGEAINYLTGSNSTNTADNQFNQVLDVLNQNGVDVNNLINSFSSSGGNTASDNTGNATIITGNASVLANLFNLANTNIFGTDAINILYQDVYGSYGGNINLGSAQSYSLADLLGTPLNITSGNDTTGFNSNNLANFDGSLTLNITNENDGTLDNDLDLAAITGGNTASDNTGNATIQTGDASIIANLINFLNSNLFTNNLSLGFINVWGDWSGNLVLPEYNSAAVGSSDFVVNNNNLYTGSGSDNETNTTLTSDNNLTNNNDGTVVNNYDLSMETGDNSASRNTRSGSIQSGSANGTVNEANWINTNVISNDPWWIILVNNMGTWTPLLISPKLADGTQIILDLDQLGLAGPQTTAQASTDPNTITTGNVMTGTLSDNQANTNLSATTNITNNNTGAITNNITAAAITGDNTADDNTGNAQIQTGDASLLVNVINFLNTNVISPSIMLTVVNVFGSWSGDILGFNQSAPQGGNTSQSQDTTTTADNQAQNTTNPSNTSPSDNNPTNNSNPVTSVITVISSAPQSASTILATIPFFSSNPVQGEESSNDSSSLSFSEEDPASSKVLGAKDYSPESAPLVDSQKVAIAILATLFGVLVTLTITQRVRLASILKRNSPTS
jgi:hypothetical protein